MEEAGLQITTDVIGNSWGLRAGSEDVAPVIIGSHIETFVTGGLYDGALGVLAGLEIIQALNDAETVTRRPVGVAFFTNEKGARFAPDMMGSGVAQGAPNCPTAMVFVPSKDGLSQNFNEFTAPEHIALGVDVLLRVVLGQAELAP